MGASVWRRTGREGDVTNQLGEELSPSDSALCVVIKKINWSRVLDEMRPHNFGGKVVVADLAEGAVQRIGALAEDPEVAQAATQTIEELTEGPESTETTTQTTKEGTENP